MIQLQRLEDCCGCCACTSACPHAAITMKEDAMGFLYPVTDTAKCTDCGICDKICAFRPVSHNNIPKAEAIRFPEFLDRSQSGGLSHALMLKAVRHGFVVYGAAMEGLKVIHKRVEEESGIEAFRLSKYVQSDMRGIAAMVRQDLASGRKVFFTGTPCQCAGIISAAGAGRKNLLVADIICHGVPGPRVWKDYCDYMGSKGHGPVRKAVFRDPSFGWHQTFETFTFDSGKITGQEYSFLYYSRMMMRPSCHACPFASIHRPSDITMGDCWGIEKAIPGFADDNRGCSLMLANTSKGEEFTADFPVSCERSEVELEKVMQLNLHSPAPSHPRSREFARVYSRKGFRTALRRYGKGALVHRWDGFLKKHHLSR